MSRPPYARHRLLVRLERAWGQLERVVDRAATPRFDPLYHTGQLAIFLLVVLAVTGIYLTVFYRPGADRAFASVAGLTTQPLGVVVRGVHRYASAALLVVAVVHALKSLLRDQVGGARWLAWVSGWVLVVTFWAIAVTGYWLVWDGTAQWLTEWAMTFGRAQGIITFFGEDLAGGTFMFFVIVLFLHVFVSVVVILGLLVHVIRISRVRIWAPRWAMVATGGALVAIAVVARVPVGEEADLHRLLGPLLLDHWYLGFLPAATRWGSGMVFAVAAAVVGGLGSMPWWVPSRRAEPPTVIPERCHGDGRCQRACPYGAIELVPRDDDTGHERLSSVVPSLCVGCGLCVGVCPTDALTMPDPSTDDLRKGLGRTVAGLDRPLVTFACVRHRVLGAAGTEVEAPIAIEEVEVDGEPVANVVVTDVCAGMVNPRWIRQAVDEGARGVVVLACPLEDCRNEEGSAQVAERLGRGWMRSREEIVLVEASPVDPVPYRTALEQVAAGRPVSPWPSGWRPRLVGAAVVALLLASVLVGFRETVVRHPADAALRVAFVHNGEVVTAPEQGIGGELAPGVDAGSVRGGRRYPVELRLVVDGVPVHEASYGPAGLRGGGASSAVEYFWLGSGSYDVELWLRDDGATWILDFAGEVELQPGRIVTLYRGQRDSAFRLLAS